MHKPTAYVALLGYTIDCPKFDHLLLSLNICMLSVTVRSLRDSVTCLNFVKSLFLHKMYIQSMTIFLLADMAISANFEKSQLLCHIYYPVCGCYF